jgi:hypothetical protein
VITLAGMQLAIPAGAVPEGTTITATPLRSLDRDGFPDLTEHFTGTKWVP